MKEQSVFIRPGLEVPLSELTFRFSRSGGPGGQHVNRSETQVELLFDVANSLSLSESQRHRLLKRLSSRLDRQGVLHLRSRGSRSQHSNKDEVIRRFVRLLQDGLRSRRPRIPTRPSSRAVQRRIARKRRRSAVKRSRSGRDWQDA